MASDIQHALPGSGLPVDYLPVWNLDATKSARFPHAIADYFASDGVSVRELRMLEFINTTTDKPKWERKVFDEEIVARWRRECSVHTDEIGDEYLSEEMFDFVRFAIMKVLRGLICLRIVYQRVKRESRNQ